MKRFYTTVTVLPVPGGGFRIALDVKPLLSPAKQKLIVPTAALAEAIAEEWRAQGDILLPHTMPLMRLASTGLDRVAVRREAVIEELLNYAGTDLLCYRAEGPAELVAREAAGWQPLIDWAMQHFDAPLRVTSGIVPIDQPIEAMKAFGGGLHRLDALRLTAVAMLAPTCGSLVLALALLQRRIDAPTCFELAMLDETYQIERWGEDAEATLRRRNIAIEIEETSRFLDLLGDEAEVAPA
jgi:chaperone required for assembly of F1-ATPase